MGYNLLRILKSLHLLISIVIVLPTAIIYGSPKLLPNYLNIQIHTIDLSNMLKANMVLYLGMCAMWVLGIWKTKYWKSATALNIFFMGTLALGRGLSMMVDGLPSGGFIFGFSAELGIGLFASYQLKIHHD